MIGNIGSNFGQNLNHQTFFIDKSVGGRANRQAGQAGRQEGRQAGRQACGQVGMWAGKPEQGRVAQLVMNSFLLLLSFRLVPKGVVSNNNNKLGLPPPFCST